MQRNLFALIALCFAVGGVLSTYESAAQTTVTGVNVTKFEATSAESQPNMFTVPMVGELKVMDNAPRFYELANKEVTLPEASDARGISAIGQQERYAETVRSFLSSRIEELKAEALFEFSDKTGADVILSPTYSIKTIKSEGLKLTLTVKVKGIPACYDKVRPITAADRALVDIDRLLVNTQSKDVKILRSTDSSQAVREEEVRK